MSVWTGLKTADNMKTQEKKERKTFHWYVKREIRSIPGALQTLIIWLAMGMVVIIGPNPIPFF
jgi:hypothetical protein